jgi:predicted nucleic acid-binding protein
LEHPEAIVSALRAPRRIDIDIDTPVFIYYIEQTSPRAIAAGAILRAVTDCRFDAVTSVFTTLEITTQPLHLGRPEAADAYEPLLGAIPKLAIVNLDTRVARIGAELRATYGLRTPDALQIAASLAHEAEAFVTNDRRLRRVGEIKVMLLEDFVKSGYREIWTILGAWLSGDTRCGEKILPAVKIQVSTGQQRPIFIARW